MDGKLQLGVHSGHTDVDLENTQTNNGFILFDKKIFTWPDQIPHCGLITITKVNNTFKGFLVFLNCGFV